MTDEKQSWNERYDQKNTPWDSGKPSQELERVLGEGLIKPSRVLEFGCRTGTNAIFLAKKGFEVTAADLSELALEQARSKAADAGVSIRFFQADILDHTDFGSPYPFVFDRGVYHHVRNVDLEAFRRTLTAVTAPGSHYLTLAGSANQPEPPEGGPPTVHAHDLCAELAPLFDLVQLREFRFDGVCVNGQPIAPLAWSALLRRR
jgi:SAM-dependent methyltransferase